MCNGARFDQHAELVRRMADALGVDVDEAMQSGRMLPEEFDLEVFDCLGCSAPHACEAWLDSREGVAKATPDFCRNKDALEALARS